MIKALFVLLGVIVILVGGVLIYATTKPDTFAVRREAVIKAPPEKIFALINDFQSWNRWSPWEKKDPAMKRTFSQSTSGKGAVYAWEGNSDVGQGRMEIAEVSPPSKVMINLDFVKPMEAHNIVEFTIEPSGEESRVTWVMSGNNNYVGKVFQVFIDMDKMVGKDFEAGLANLKVAAEG